MAAMMLVMAIPAGRSLAQQQADLQPRQPLAGMNEQQLMNPPDRPYELRVKFTDAAQVRAAADGPISRTGRDTTALSRILTDHEATLEPLIDLPAQTLESIRQRAAQRSGRAQPDLAAMMRVQADADALPNVARALNELAIVEWLWYVKLLPPPPCEDLAPTTPGYRNMQGYIDGNPGLSAQCAQHAWNADGAGVRIADCEYGLNVDHEDLCDIIMEPGQTIHPDVFQAGWDRHGTAVAGVLYGGDNGYGVTGLAPQAEMHFFSEWTEQGGFRRAECIAAAMAALDAGDVILLEMQAFGPSNILSPAEFDLHVWTLTQTATDAGIIVVAAAGNGGTNLDGPAFSSYLDRGDSGAILVGAGTASTVHLPLSFSNYGSRVNVQGWGHVVFTTGYGEFAQHGGDANQRYTAVFNGTSSASALVAGACAALQSAVLQETGTVLTPMQMRDVLIDTGWPQTGTQHIGPAPNVVAALRSLGLEAQDCLGNGRPNVCDIADGSSADVNGNGVPDACEAEGDLNGDGVTGVLDLLMLLQQWGPCASECASTCPADLLAPDCAVDGLDLAALLDNWG